MKKINIAKKIALRVMAIALLTSCNSMLDYTPIDKVSDASFYKTANDFLLSANQMYTYLRTFEPVVSVDNPQNFPHNDNRGDLIGGVNAYSQGSNSIPATDNFWNNAYSDPTNGVPTGAWSRIRTINYMLSKAEGYSSPSEIAKYVAEAKFFRAYMYFDLLQQYGGVPVITKPPVDANDPIQFAPRDSRDAVVDLIMADLHDAISVLPEVYSTDVNWGRVGKSAARAFLSRVALYEGTWQKYMDSPNLSRANALLDTAIAASTPSLYTSYSLFAPANLGDSAQKYMFILENEKSNPAGVAKSANKEYILANRYAQTVRQISFNITRVAYINVSASKKMADMYLCQDGLPIDKSSQFQGYSTQVSEFQNRDNRMRYTLKIPGTRYWVGYSNPKVDWTSSSAAEIASSTVYNPTTGGSYGVQKWAAERNVPQGQEGYDYPVIRLAEVLLNYAEAVYERNGSISDADLDISLNLVRNRVNKTMPKLSNSLVTTNALDMQAEIRRERSIELFLEGFRPDDLKRWHTAVAELGTPILGITYTGTASNSWPVKWPAGASVAKDPTTNAVIIDAARSFSAKNYLLPIPSQQIQLNTNLEQNPDW